MGQLISKIVLTGGPCAGKTTALAQIEENLTELGYHVFIVSESATELIKGGIRPFGFDSIDLLDFQYTILNYQLSKEKIYESAVSFLKENSKCVIIYDRGAIDNKAYIGQEKFNLILNHLGLNELQIMDNYDMVLHLVTAADGKQENYTLGNNSARKETIEEAKALDRATLNAWSGHNNLKIIDNDINFEDKMRKVINEINNLLGNPITIKNQRKYLIDLNKTKLDFLTENTPTKVEIEQTYLENDDFEKRLRKRTYSGQSTYYITIQRKDGCKSKIITDKKITEKEYLKFLSSNQILGSLNKIRYSFIKDKQYFKLDIFDNGMAILELEPTLENKGINIPDFVTVIDDVTGNKEYDNINLVMKDKVKINQ